MLMTVCFSPSNQVIDEIITKLSHTFKTGDQGTIQDFLGICISMDANGAIYLQQPGLINEILQDLQLLDAHPKPPPTIHVLHPDSNGHPREER
jgi:hypothetical protein